MSDKPKLLALLMKIVLALGTSNPLDNGSSHQNIKFSVHESQHQFFQFLPSICP
jgi:hypothetical protein